MTKVRLGELIRPITGRAGSQDLPVYSVTKHRGFVPSREYFTKQVFSNDVTTYKVVDRGQFAYSTIHLDEGSIGIAPEPCLISPMYTVFAADESRVDSSYLIRYLKSPVAMASYPRLGRGTAERRKSIPLVALGKLEVPLPPLTEQRRIAAILDEADRLQASARRVKRLLLTLASTAFVRAVDGAPTQPLGAVSRMYGGSSLPEGLPFVGQDGGFLCLKVSDMNRPENALGIRHAASWSPIPGSRASTAPAGSVIIPKRGGAISTNKKAVLLRPAILDPNLMAIAADSVNLGSTTLLAWFRTLDLRTIQSGSSVPQLNKQDLAPLAVPVPTVQEQARLEHRTDEILREAALARERAGSLDTLFASLQHRAFRGEL